MESDRQRFDRIAKIYAQRLAGEEPSEEEWEDIFFVAPFGIWQAEQEQRPAKFATLAYYSAAAPHSDFAMKVLSTLIRHTPSEWPTSFSRSFRQSNSPYSREPKRPTSHTQAHPVHAP